MAFPSFCTEEPGTPPSDVIESDLDPYVPLYGLLALVL